VIRERTGFTVVSPEREYDGLLLNGSRETVFRSLYGGYRSLSYARQHERTMIYYAAGNNIKPVRDANSRGKQRTVLGCFPEYPPALPLEERREIDLRTKVAGRSCTR